MIKLSQPDTEYHSDPSIGSTTAKLWMESPQLFADEINGRRPRKDSRAFQFGRAAHAFFTDTALFDRCISTGPINEKTGKPYGADTKAHTEWAAENPGKIILGQSEINDLRTMDSRMPAEIRAILEAEKVVESSYYQSIAGVPVKCRPDVISRGAIHDLKTVGNINDCEKHLTKFKYWFSAAWYRMIVRAESGISMPFRFIFAEKASPFRWRLIDMDADWMGWADDTVDRVVGEIGHAFATMDFSDKSPVHQIVSRPAWESDENTEEGE
jgi:hypothetical protein